MAALTGKMFRLLEVRPLTRRTLRNEVILAMQECRDFQFYKRGARLMLPQHATNAPPNLQDRVPAFEKNAEGPWSEHHQ